MTTRLRLLFAVTASVAAAAILVATGGATSRDTVLPTLKVEYTLGCTFTIEDDAGRRVSSIAPGTYQVQVVTPVPFAQIDLSDTNDLTACKSFVQFQLSGPGVALFTTLLDGDEDDDMVAATFQPSASYVAQDLNHAAATRTVLTTTATGSPTAPASPYVPSASATKPTASKDIVGSALKSNPLRGTIAATVDASGKPKLLFRGKPVATLKGGRYTTTVVDDSKKAGLVIQLLGKTGRPLKALTLSNVSFVGRHTTTVTLQKGQWAFATSDSGKRTYFIVVA
jgi:hypothetical protein